MNTDLSHNEFYSLLGEYYLAQTESEEEVHSVDKDSRKKSKSKLAVCLVYMNFGIVFSSSYSGTCSEQDTQL